MPIQNIGQDVISAYLAATRIRDQREQDTREHLLREQQFEEAKKQFTEQMKRAEQEFAARNAIEQSKLKLLQTQAIPEVSKGMMEGLIPSQPSPMDNTTPEFMQALQTGDFGKAYQLRSVGMKDILGLPDELVVPSPESYAATQDVLLGPAARAKAQAEAQGFNLTFPARQALAREQNLGRYTIAAMQVNESFKRTQEQNKARLEAAKLSADARIKAAQIAHTAGVNSDEAIDAAEMAATGLIDITNVPTKTRGTVITILNKNGLVPIKTKIAEGIRNDTSKADSIIQEMDTALEKWKGEFGGPLKGISGRVSAFANVTDFGNDISRLNAQMGNLMSTFGGESGARISDKDRERLDSLRLNPYLSYKKNKENLVEMGKIFKRTIDTKLGYIPSNQRNKLLSDLNVKYLKESDQKLIIQQSTSDSSKFRYSRDGGKTWQNGKPGEQ